MGLLSPLIKSAKLFRSLTSGQSLVELLVAMGLAAILLPALLTGVITSREGRPQAASRSRAATLLRESSEALRVVRESGWAAVSTDGSYHLVPSANTWALAAGSEVTADNFTRTIVISSVSRNLAGDIVVSGGIVDPSTKRVDITVSWAEPYASSLTSSYYLTRYLDNLAYIQTTEAEFDTGLVNNVDVVNSSGGELQISANNKAKWCSPEFSPSTIDLPDGPPVAVAARANAVTTVPNDVLVATAPNTSSSIKMAYLKVTANTDPPVSTLNGIFTLDPAQYSSPGLVPSGLGLDNTFKTTDIKYYTSSSDKLYALIGTNLPDKEVIAVQVDDTNLQDPVNKIYKFWTYFNTRIYTPDVIVDTGFANPSANAAATGGDGDGFLSNPTRAYTDNTQQAVDTNSGSGTSTLCGGSDKDRHRYYNYGFSIPGGVSISGIEVRLDAWADSTTGSPFMCVELSWDGGTTWTSAQSTTALSTSQTTKLLGGSSDTWGRTWTPDDFSNTNFRVRITNVSSNTSRDFSLDWVGVKVYHTSSASVSNDSAPFGYGGSTLEVLGDTAYVASGGYLYAFDLSDIDSKSPSDELDQLGCRIQLDGYDCSPGTGVDRKYSSGETGTSWSDTTSPAHIDCSDGGNIELFASNDLSAVEVGGNKYIYVAVGAGTNPEMDIVNVSSVPTSSSSPSVSSSSCGRISGGNSGWQRIGSLDFNSQSATEEAANSVFAKSDGTRAYISSNGGIDGNNNGQPDSRQFYVVNTTNKSSPQFLSGSSSTGATSGYYYGTGDLAELYPRRSLTVLNGERVVLVGRDGISNGNDTQEYQVLNLEDEATPAYCNGINFDSGFNDLVAVTEADTDNFVYMIANTTLNELKIIQGGPDGLYADSGSYESEIYDVGYSTVFNRLSATTVLPANTTVQYQVAIADAVSGSCAAANFVYVGPDGTSGTYFSAAGDKIVADDDGSGYENPGRCFKYRAYLSTTDYNITPQVLDVSVNLSP